VKTYTAYIEWDPETQMYTGIVPEVAGVQTQAVSIEEVQANLKELLDLSFKETDETSTESDFFEFINFQPMDEFFEP
jgi:predicted RNase H-like HicB family nuclease